MARHPRRFSFAPQFDRQNTDGRNSGSWWRLALAVGWLVLAWLILCPQPTIRAQEVAPTPASSHVLYLPLLAGEQGERKSLSGHGEWPGGRTYTVSPDDTLLSVALEMGVDLEQMACLLAPTFSWDQPLVIGDSLRVPETPFACHQVQPGETLTSIAEAYDVSPEVIQAEGWNDLDDEPIPGHNLRIPLLPGPDASAGELALAEGWTSNEVQSLVGPSAPVDDASTLPADWPYGSGEFAWPTHGWITQGYGVGHSAIDIAAYLGTPVTAADRGVVIRAGWSTVGYGQFVIIDHNIDYITLYAHLNEIYVEEGQIVAKGQLLGRVGSTGNSTGPHLHFEIRDFGKRVDPLTLLPY